MTFFSKAGNFALNTGLGNQSIIGLGFQPKIVLFIATIATGSGVGNHQNLAFGFGISSTDRGSMAVNDEDGQTTTDNTRNITDAEGILVLDEGLTSVDYSFDIVSMDADGFTIDVDNAPGDAKIIGYLALGGSDLQVSSTTFTGSGGAGNQAIAGAGFAPDAAMIFSIDSGAIPQSSSNNSLALGFASATSERGALGIVSRNNVGTSESDRVQVTDKIIHQLTPVGGTVTASADIASFDADGITINWTNASGSDFFVLFFEGVNFFVGSLTSQTGTGTFSETGVGFQGEAGLFLSFCNAANAAAQTNLEISLGIVTATDERFVAGGTSEDAQGTSDADHFLDTTKLYQNYDFTQTKEGDIDFISWDADGFTLDQTDADPIGNEILYFIIGPSQDVDLDLLESKWQTFQLGIEQPLQLAVLPDQRPEIITPGLAEYKVRLKDQDGILVAEFDQDAWVSLSFTHIVNKRGAIRLELSGEDDRIGLFELDGQIEVWRRNKIVNLDWYLEWEGFFRTDNDLFTGSDVNREVAYGFSYLDLARRSFIMWSPNDSQGNKNDVAENAMIEFANENIGPGALETDGRKADQIMPGLSIQASTGAGATWEGTEANNNLLDVLNKIAAFTTSQGLPVDFDIIGVGVALYEFQTYVGQRGLDRTQENSDGNVPITFSLGFGNMAEPLLSRNRSTEKTAIYALGRGAESERQIELQEASAKDDSPWNRIEGVINATDLTGEDQTFQLQSAAFMALEDNKFEEELSFNTLQLRNIYYGKDYSWGDRVTAAFKTRNFDKKIIEARITVSANVGGEKIELVFGELTGKRVSLPRPSRTNIPVPASAPSGGGGGGGTAEAVAASVESAEPTPPGVENETNVVATAVSTINNIQQVAAQIVNPEQPFEIKGTSGNFSAASSWNGRYVINTADNTASIFVGGSWHLVF